MTQKEYIQNVLINEIEDVMIKHKWLSFVLIASGIELLGTLIENPKKGFDEQKLSGKRFRKAIDKLFPSKYKQYNNKKSKYDLYRELRCGLSHSTISKPTLGLSEKKHKQKHLSIRTDGILVLVSEDFFDDFKKACEKVISKIDTKEITDRFSVKII